MDSVTKKQIIVVDPCKTKGSEKEIIMMKKIIEKTKRVADRTKKVIEEDKDMRANKEVYFYGSKEHVDDCLDRVTKNNIRTIIANIIIILAWAINVTAAVMLVVNLVNGTIAINWPIVTGLALVGIALSAIGASLSIKARTELYQLLAISDVDSIFSEAEIDKVLSDAVSASFKKYRA